jgi:hypothetical protein
MNKLIEMFDLDKVRQMIKECSKNEMVILCTHWSVNRPKYSDEEHEIACEQFDMEDFEAEVGCLLIWTDGDDLVLDPHGVYQF